MDEAEGGAKEREEEQDDGEGVNVDHCADHDKSQSQHAEPVDDKPAEAMAWDRICDEPRAKKEAEEERAMLESQDQNENERSCLKGKSGRGEQKLTQEAKESVEKYNGDADPTESGGGKCCKTKFADFHKDCELIKLRWMVEK